jgi:hypothetical protein
VGFNLVERPVCESHGICIYVLYLGLDLYTVELYIVCTIYLGFEKGIKVSKIPQIGDREGYSQCG